MKSLQDRVCDALTLAGLLAVIGFGSASLLPERGAGDAPATPTDADSRAAMPVDTMPELPAAPVPTAVKEEPVQETIADTLLPDAEQPADTAATHTDAATHASQAEHHTEADDKAEHHTDDKPQSEHTDNLFE